MSEAPTIGPAINLHDPAEVAYWVRRLGITSKQLVHLVQTLRVRVPVHTPPSLSESKPDIIISG